MSSAMTSKGSLSGWSPYVKIYDALKAGSIDGTDLIPHDNAVVRAMCAEYTPPDERTVTSNPSLTLFVGRLNLKTSDRQLHEEFSRYGQVKSCHVVRDVVTGISRGYGFVEFKIEADALKAWKQAHSSIFHERQILVEWEFARVLPGWIPRRLGGGLGGKKESGQLRFGGRDRPFKRPLILPPEQEQHHATPDSKPSLKSYDRKEDLKDRFNDREEEFSLSSFKFSRYEHDKRSWSQNYEGERQHKRLYEEKYSNQSYYNEYKRRYNTQTEDTYSDQAYYKDERRKYHKYTEGNFTDQSSYHDDRRKHRSHHEENYADQPSLEEKVQKYQTLAKGKYSDQYYIAEDRKKFRKYRESNNVEEPKHQKNYSDTDKLSRKEYGRGNHDYGDNSEHSLRDFGSSSHCEGGTRRNKQSRQGEDIDSYYDTFLLDDREMETEVSRNNYNDRVESQNHKRKHKRSISTDSSNSMLFSSKSKHKKSKHKTRRHKSDSSDPSLESTTSTKKLKKKKKKKSKRSKKKHSSEGETD